MANQRKMELELKLGGAAEDVARLRGSALISALRNGAETHERLVSTYYDTQRGDLSAEGFSLRLRHEGGRRIQTMKRAGAGGSTLMRREEERELKPGERFPAQPDDADFAEALAPFAAALTPVSRTTTDRWTSELHYKGARIEAAFDIGRAEVFAGAAVAATGPIAEAEFELLEGRARGLFALTREAARASNGRLRIGAASKAEQAQRLLRPGAVPPEAPIRLEADDTASDAFAAALAASARRLADCQPAVIAARAPEGAHQMRVALRRLRAVERLFRKALRCEETENLAARASGFAAKLGPARDWDVFCEKTMPDVALRAGGGDGFDALAVRAFALRASAWDAAAADIGGLSFQKFLIDLQEVGERRRWKKTAKRAVSKPAKAFARRALDKRLAAVKSAGDALASGANAEMRHDLRIELKKLRYAAQLFRPLFSGAGRKRYLSTIAALQDGLGAINDAAVAERLALEAAQGQGGAALRAAGVLAGYCAREAETTAAHIAADYAAFARTPPFWEKAKAERLLADEDAMLA